MSPTEPGWDEGTERLDIETLAAGSRGGELPEPGHVGAGTSTRQDKEEQRRHLRLVENQAKRRAGRRRLLVILGIASAAVVCLALVALHVLIAENQFRLDRLQQQAATEQASYEKLRLQVAQLEAPARIVSQAEGRLGMVQPATVTYLPATTSTPATTAVTPATTAGRTRKAGRATKERRPLQAAARKLKICNPSTRRRRARWPLLRVVRTGRRSSRT